MMTGKQVLYGLSVALAFGIGCGAGAGASGVGVPPVRAGTSPQKWEHHCFKGKALGAEEEATRRANELGAEGWELVGMVTKFVCFKRPL